MYITKTTKSCYLANKFGVPHLLLLICITMCAIPQNTSASESDPQSEPIVGMWVWKDQWINTDAEQDRLIAFSKQYNINRLLLNVHYDVDESHGYRPTIRYPKELARILILARDAGIKIEALDSSQNIGPEDQAKLMARLDTLIVFNNTLPDNARFVGIHYDIEPQVTKPFKASYESRIIVMRDMLTFFAGVNAKLRHDAPDMTLACDIAMWLDQRTEGERSCMVEFLGQTKNLQAHIQDLTDYIGVMSYRRFATGDNSVTYHIKTEVDYANKIGRGVCAGVETGKKTADPSETSTISFYGLPSNVFWDEVNKIHETYQGQSGYHGVLIHCYGRFIEYLEDNPPKQK